jgi:uncharacterized protein (TIRG00374 family)
MNAWVKFVLKAAVSAALIAYLLGKVDIREVWMTIRGANWVVLCFAFLLFYVGFTITAARWQTLLRALGDSTDYWFLVRSFMVAIFFSNFLPSTIGGDAMRMYDSWRAGSSKTQAVAAVVMDRFLGLLALLVFALAAVWLGEYAALYDSNLLQLTIFGAAAAIIALLVIVFMPTSLLSWLQRAAGRLQPRLRSIADAILKSLSAFRNSRGALAIALGLSFLLQANVVLYHWIVAGALGISVPLSAFFLIVPIAIVVMMIPISINGIGVRESLFVLLLSAHGVTQAEGLAFAWILYALLLLQGLVGGVVFALRKERRCTA